MSKYAEYLKILDLPKDASLDDIKKAYRELANIWHPDKNSKNLEKRTTEKFKKIKEAYDYLIKNYSNNACSGNGGQEEYNFEDYSYKNQSSRNTKTKKTEQKNTNEEYDKFNVDINADFEYLAYKIHYKARAIIAVIILILFAGMYFSFPVTKTDKTNIAQDENLNKHEKQSVQTSHQQMGNENIEEQPQEVENTNLKEETFDNEEKIKVVQKDNRPVAPKIDKTEIENYKVALRNNIASKIDFAHIYGNGNCIVGFSVDNSGKIINSQFIQESPNYSLNGIVINAVRNTPYFYIPPVGYNGETLNLSIKFYNGEYEVNLY